MKLTTPHEGMAAYQSYRFHPPDPAWVNSGALELARRKLREFDGRVAIWWSPYRRAAFDSERPGRWRIMEWMPKLGSWSTAFYWEGDHGEYREILPVDPIIRRLQAIAKPLDKVLDETDRANEQREGTRKKEIREMVNEHHADLLERHIGVRQTFGPGYIRRRQVKPKDVANTNHLKAVAAHAKKWDGAKS